MFRPGSAEIVVGRSIAERFSGVGSASGCALANASGPW